MSVGYVGLGNMGGQLAQRLLLQIPLQVYDLNLPSIQALVSAGATACDRLANLAAKCSTILICLPTSDHVRTVIFGEGGIAASAKPGTQIIDQTTGDPQATRKMAAELAERGLELLDAPVSGGRWGQRRAPSLSWWVAPTNSSSASDTPFRSSVPTCSTLVMSVPAT